MKSGLRLLMASMALMAHAEPNVSVLSDPYQGLEYTPYMNPLRFQSRRAAKGSTINQRKRRKYARQNPHSKYNR